MMIARRGFLAGLLSCPICAAAAGAQTLPHWDYEHAGPDKWADLDPRFAVCARGDQQSPVDLHDGLRSELPSIRVQWKSEGLKVANNGHTLQLNTGPGNVIGIGKEQFSLVQFHFHTPSEHAVAGKRTAMEVHFVHQHQSGRLAVVGVFLIPGQKNGAFSAIMAAAPRREGEQALPKTVNPRDLLPKDLALAWRYEGSLTTPPCSETVDWIVLDQPVAVAQPDIDAFKAIFPSNARSLQPLNRRYLLRG